MGNTKKGDGYKYRGRGYVQLTWYNNYKAAGDYLGKDVINNPDMVLEQKDAAKIMIYGMEMGMFTGQKISFFISSNKCDYFNARKVINGLDKAKQIANYAMELEKCLKWL